MPPAHCLATAASYLFGRSTGLHLLKATEQSAIQIHPTHKMVTYYDLLHFFQPKIPYKNRIHWCKVRICVENQTVLYKDISLYTPFSFNVRLSLLISTFNIYYYIPVSLIILMIILLYYWIFYFCMGLIFLILLLGGNVIKCVMVKL